MALAVISIICTGVLLHPARALNIIYPGHESSVTDGDSDIIMECKPLTDCPVLLDLALTKELGSDKLGQFIPCGQDTFDNFEQPYLCPTPSGTVEEKVDQCQCKPIMSCPAMRKLAEEKKWQEINDNYKICGFDGVTPKYCC